jgi:hypothetical protein
MTADELIKAKLAEVDRIVAGVFRRDEDAVLTHPDFNGDREALDRLVGEARAEWRAKRDEIEAWMRDCLREAAEAES